MQGLKNNNFSSDSGFIRHRNVFVFTAIKVHLINTRAFGHCVFFGAVRSLPPPPPPLKSKDARTPMLRFDISPLERVEFLLQ